MTKTRPETLRPELGAALLPANPSSTTAYFQPRVPPVALMAAAALLMWFASWNTPGFEFPLPANVLCSASLTLAGVLVCLAGVSSFQRAKTTVNPMQPASASALVTRGIYQYSRNPMYLGFVVVLLGWAALLSNAVALLVLPAFVLYMEHFQIGPEEVALSSRFGPDYERYQAAVRRWL